MLLLTYQNATDAYSRTVTHLTKGVGVLFGEYEFRNQNVKAAREASVEARAGTVKSRRDAVLGEPSSSLKIP